MLISNARGHELTLTKNTELPKYGGWGGGRRSQKIESRIFGPSKPTYFCNKINLTF